MSKKLLILIAVFALISVNANAQFKNYGIKGGAKYEQLIPFSEYNSSYSFIGKGYLGIELTSTLCIEIGAGYGQYKTKDNYNPVTGIYDSYGSSYDSANTEGGYVKLI